MGYRVQRLRSHTLVASIPYQSTPLAIINYHPEFISVHKRLGKCVLMDDFVLSFI